MSVVVLPLSLWPGAVKGVGGVACQHSLLIARGDVVSGVEGSPRRRTFTPLSDLSLRRSISRLASISSDILFASRSRASRSVRCRRVSLTGGAMKGAKGSPWNCEPFRGFLETSTTVGGGEGVGEGPDMGRGEELGRESSGGRLSNSRGKRRRKEWKE